MEKVILIIKAPFYAQVVIDLFNISHLDKN